MASQWRFMMIVGVAVVIFLQTSVTGFNWLMLVAVWLGMRCRWGEIFLMGLGLDLVAGERLGQSSAMFLAIGGGVYWLNQQLRLRFKSQDIHLRLD